MTDHDVSNRQRVAILGAGPAGLATAFELAETGKYDIHVYQMGWRAGGKCATGREAGHHRTRQNGSHYLFGCYHNSFSLIRRAHNVIAESNHADRHMFGTFEHDFVARNLLVGRQVYSRGTSPDDEDEQAWHRYMPQNMAMPGEGGKFPTPFDLMLTGLQFAVGTVIDFIFAICLFWTKTDRFEGVRLCLAGLPLCPFEHHLHARVLRRVLQPIRYVFNAIVRVFATVFHGLSIAAEALVPAMILKRAEAAWSWLWSILVKCLRGVGNVFVAIGLRMPGPFSRRIQRLFILFDLGLTVIKGYFADGLNRPGGFEKIDRLDLREWLLEHGASNRAVYSALVMTWYDAVIAYEDGDKEKGRCSAGAAVHAILRALLGYKGAFAFQMRAEVGDSYIAPIVKALEIKGVKFHFYSRVKRIVVGTHEPFVKNIVLAMQTTKSPESPEFIEVPDHANGGVRRKCWPATPLSGEETVPPLDSYYCTTEVGERTLNRRRPGDREAPAEEFDIVVSALPMEVMRDVLVDEQGRQVGDRDGPWKECFANIKWTESQAVRIWFKVPLGPDRASNSRSLGWTHAPPILSGYEWPHSTWEDNSQSADIHSFPHDQSPKTIATVFGPLLSRGCDIRDPDHPGAQLENARHAAKKFAEAYMLELWNGLERSAGSKEVDWDAFIDLSGGTGKERFDWQHVVANVGPIESYVMALPGTLVHRLRADESGYRNLYLAGDWTRNGVDVGSVEAAVISGMKAAKAISGSPKNIMGAHDFERGTLFQPAIGLEAN